MSTSLTRRGLVINGVPAALLAAAVPALAAGAAGPDAELLALREPYARTMAGIDAALTAKSRIDEQVFARSRSYPDFENWPGSIADFSATCAAIIAERKTIGATLGSDAADALEDETGDANGAVVEEIEAMPAHTLAGLAFKVEVSEEQNHGRPELIDSIMADIKALAMGGLDA